MALLTSCAMNGPTFGLTLGRKFGAHTSLARVADRRVLDLRSTVGLAMAHKLQMQTEEPEV